jgi:hypothetical protein
MPMKETRRAMPARIHWTCAPAATRAKSCRAYPDASLTGVGRTAVEALFGKMGPFDHLVYT